MSAEIGDLQRRLANIVRIGTVTAINHADARVKVTFDGVTSPWLPWATGRAGAVKDWSPPSIGEQVCILSPTGELGAGFVMAGGINSDAHGSPDSRADVYRIDVPSGGAYEVHVGGAVILADNGKIQLLVGGSTFKIIGGKVTFDGDLEVTGDVKAGSISLKTHTHGGVTSGGSSTTLPE